MYLKSTKADKGLIFVRCFFFTKISVYSKVRNSNGIMFSMCVPIKKYKLTMFE